MELKVFTLNCWGLAVVSRDRIHRIKAIGEMLATSHYDVVCLQEIWLKSDYELIKHKVSGVLPYSHYFYSGVTGSGICILSRHTMEEVFFHQWPVNGYIHKIHHGDWFGGKGLHAEYNRKCDEYQAHRVLQAFDTAQFIQMTSGGADLVILAGDLNTEPGDLAYRIILNVSGFTDAFNEAGETVQDMAATCESLTNSYTPTALLKKNIPGKRLDYIMYHSSSNLQVDLKSYELPLPNKVPECSYSYSDHEAVAATLIISRMDDSEEAIVETEEPVIDIPYESPEPLDPKRIYLAEHFDDLDQFAKRWVKSQAKKEGISEDIAKYDGEWQIEGAGKDGLVGDKGLVLKSKAKHAAIASSLLKPFNFDTKPLIVQYEVIFQDGQECGGAYLKLLSQGPETQNLNNFHDKTPYSIMFGPDKCGNDHKLHFIFKHRNPLNGSLEEKHCKKPKERIEDAFSDKLPHLFTLVLQPDNTFEISLDRKIVNSGSLLEDFTPTVNPPKEIDDPNDKKPEDWDEREKIADPEAVKPDDWDEDAPAQIVDESAVMPEGWLENEPTHIPDPDAKKPDDWDTEMDGEWEPPLIDNPLCKDAVGCGSWEPPLINNPEFKGKWRAPLIDNPNYKGKWRPRRIANPEFFEDKHPFKMQAVSAVGFELWSMSKDIFFDNVIITDDLAVADHWAAATFDKKRQKIAKDSESVIQKLATLTNEYPWLWGVYILVLGIPVVLVLYLCCKPGSSASQSQEKEELRQAAQNKKTDEPTEDVEEEAKEEVEEAEVENPEDDDREKNSGPDTDEEEESEGKTEDHSPKGSGDGARKRKVRKE
ncbi:hypothetical protein GEV33_014666 [Tenebrio molitor]|uniref:Endonuclease/exonuclease/phosphatase domain-containing protein n=1 Tax=Tenebrio molitor TaxID=7067 RepID=A0A8J6H4U7_TENMO|nr:hypothetical protein GEV33_014678 [Tenebrio molitor]KAH0808123.1 hypothetical protein GEV33_014666 [Tenebrio molitor]